MMMGETIASMYYLVSPVNNFLGPEAEAQQPGKKAQGCNVGKWGQPAWRTCFVCLYHLVL